MNISVRRSCRPRDHHRSQTLALRHRSRVAIGLPYDDVAAFRISQLVIDQPVPYSHFMGTSPCARRRHATTRGRSPWRRSNLRPLTHPRGFSHHYAGLGLARPSTPAAQRPSSVCFFYRRTSVSSAVAPVRLGFQALRSSVCFFPQNHRSWVVITPRTRRHRNVGTKSRLPWQSITSIPGIGVSSCLAVENSAALILKIGRT